MTDLKRWHTILNKIKGLPTVFSLRSNADLKNEIAQRKLMEEQLLLRENRFKSLVQEGGDLIGIMDENGVFLYVSPTTVPILGVQPEELTGKNVFDKIHPEELDMALATFARIKTEKRIKVETLRYSFKEGEYRWIDAVITNSLDDPSINGIIVNARDVTERINEQQRFTRMFAEAPLCMCILKGPQHVFIDANENYSILTGRRNIEGKTVREVFPELNDQDFFHWLDEVYHTGKTFTGHETPLTVDLHGNGTLTTRYINFIYQPYFDSEGKIEGIFYFGTDVTEQVEMRKKLEQNEKRFRSLIENSHDILVLFDKEGTRKYVSPAFERTLGYQQSEVIGNRVFDKVHPEDAGNLYTVMTNAFENPGASIEACARFKKKDGNYAWLEGYITNMLHVEEVNALVINFRNIDERKKGEEEKELVLKISNIFSRENNLKECLDAALKTLCSFTGAKGAEAWITSIDQKEITLVSCYLAQAATTHPMKEKFALGEGVTGKVWQLKDPLYISNIPGNEAFKRKEFAQKNGLNSAWVIPVIFKEQVTAVIVLYSGENKDKRLKRLGQNVLVQLASDIQRKKIEKQAESFSKRIGVILESITDPFYTIDNNYTITYWNQQAAKLLGVDKKAIMGKNLWEVFPIAKELKFFTEYEKALKENRSARFEAFYPPTNMWFDVSAYPLDEGLGIYIRDITDAKKNYQDLVKTETDVRNFARQLNFMLEEERSRIAREIHDEFGQQLAAIKMSVAFSKLLLEGNEEVKQKLDEISLDIDNTMNSLRSFATELRPGILDTMGLIPSLEWLAKEFEKKTGVNSYIDADTNEQDLEKALATCYFRICQEALTNVLKHAQAKNVVIQVYKENNELIMNIMDDGIGIVEEKIQNPFSMGILGMKERANLIGGTLSILKGSNGGTIVQLKAKIHAE